MENAKMENSVLLDLPIEKVPKPATSYTKFDKSYDNFHIMHHLEPHSVRKKKILEKYPEIEKLFVKEPLTILWVIIIHIFQLVICNSIYHFKPGYISILCISIMIGAILNHALFVLIHDITHNNISKSLKLNKVFAIFANLPQIIPSAIGFGIYHKDHHHFLGDSIKDPDIPTIWEIKNINTILKRLLYIIFMPFFYGLRPYFKAPKMISFMELMNLVACICYTYSIYIYFGVMSIFYLISSTYLGLSIHPVGAHVIAEHYEFFKGQDTYSYYGWINFLNFNMGYHVEHHDFPNIPWNKLPYVRKVAPEFYNTLPTVDSYFTTIYKYIFDTTIGPWSRITLAEKEE